MDNSLALPPHQSEISPTTEQLIKSRCLAIFDAVNARDFERIAAKYVAGRFRGSYERKNKHATFNREGLVQWTALLTNTYPEYYTKVEEIVTEASQAEDQVNLWIRGWDEGLNGQGRREFIAWHTWTCVKEEWLLTEARGISNLPLFTG